ncbi:MAG: hypothetical protein WA966_02345 [Ornithinimicrobium sp.]
MRLVVGATGFAGTLLLTQVGSLGGPTADSGAPVVAEVMPDYSYLTGEVSRAAPGRGIALYQQGYGVEVMDFPQAVLLGADGASTRRVDYAEGRGGPQMQGDPAPMLLSPEGRRVAVGAFDTSPTELGVVNLEDGSVRTHDLGGDRSVQPLAWSIDGRYLALAATAETYRPYGELNPRRFRGEAWLLDTESGARRSLGDAEASAAAFSTSGNELALDHGGEVTIVNLRGEELRTIEISAGLALNGPNAWSPDDALLAMTDLSTAHCQAAVDAAETYDDATWTECVRDIEGISFVAAQGDASTAVPTPIRRATAGEGLVLGWRGDRDVVVLDNSDRDVDGAQYYLRSVSLSDGKSESLSQITGAGNFEVGSFQMASALAPDLEVVPAGPVDRGPWPWTPAIAVSLTAALIAGVALRLGRRSLPL